MTLLEEIQNSAVDGKSDLGMLLRKCKLLAARLGSQPLEDWLIWESNGYPDDIPVPEYRIWPLEVKGHFSGPMGSGLRNAPIPFSCLPEKVRKRYMYYECRSSIASIEAILNEAPPGKTVEVSTGDLAVRLGGKVYKYQNCIQAWAEFGTSALVEVLNSVRNRLLDFALALWKEAPNAGEVGNGSSAMLEIKKVTQIFNTTVYGGSANIVGTSSVSAITFNIVAKDFSSLERVFLENGVPEEEITLLRSVIDSEPAPITKGKFGPQVSAWIAKMMRKAAEGSWSIGLAAAGNLLAQAISKYYGF